MWNDSTAIYEQTGEHQEWTLIDWDNKVVPLEDSKDLNQFKYTLVLRREASFYFTVLILPCIILNILSLTVFTLSVTDTGRMDFCLALILTYFVLIMIVVDSSPPSGDQIPILGLYIILSTAIVAMTFAMSMSLVEIHEHFREKGRRMPAVLSRLLEKYFSLQRRFTAFKKERGIVTHNNNADEENFTSKDEDAQAFLNSTKESSSISDDQLREMFKWKLLGKILNIIFLVMTFLAHVAVAVATFVY